MSAQRFVEESRTALAEITGAGAVSMGVEAWKRLAASSSAMGLTDLAGLFRALATVLGQRGSLAFEPSVRVASLVCAIHDRVEALASALAIWRVESDFKA